MNRLADYSIMGLSIIVFGGSIFLFGRFIFFGPFTIFRFAASETQVLIWDGFLSMMFFIQHSAMTRTLFRHRLSSTISRRYHWAFFAMVSSIVLSLVVLLWQPSSAEVLFNLPVQLRFLPLAMILIAIGGFLWGVFSLRKFDPFGLAAIRAHLERKHFSLAGFVIRWPSLLARHPLHTCIIIFIWSSPDMHSDRLLFNVLWTLWILAGAYLEERNLVAEFSDRYLLHRKAVPMLLPWKGTASQLRISASTRERSGF